MGIAWGWRQHTPKSKQKVRALQTFRFSPTLLNSKYRLKHLINYWMDCHERLYIHGSQRMKLDDLSSSAPHNDDILGEIVITYCLRCVLQSCLTVEHTDHNKTTHSNLKWELWARSGCPQNACLDIEGVWQDDTIFCLRSDLCSSMDCVHARMRKFSLKTFICL